MDRRTRARLTTRARVLKALAHPTRLLIVQQLGRHERGVGELTALVGADISTVSRHLALLRQAGIVADEKRGAAVCCSLRCRCALKFLACVEEVLRSSAAAERRLRVRPRQRPKSRPSRKPSRRRRA